MRDDCCLDEKRQDRYDGVRTTPNRSLSDRTAKPRDFQERRERKRAERRGRDEVRTLESASRPSWGFY